jgi:hypothetical protein
MLSTSLFATQNRCSDIARKQMLAITIDQTNHRSTVAGLLVLFHCAMWYPCPAPRTPICAAMNVIAVKIYLVIWECKITMHSFLVLGFSGILWPGLPTARPTEPSLPVLLVFCQVMRDLLFICPKSCPYILGSTILLILPPSLTDEWLGTYFERYSCPCLSLASYDQVTNSGSCHINLYYVHHLYFSY